PQSELKLSLDRKGLDEVITPEIQKDILLLELDPNPLLKNSLEQMMDMCGTEWRKDQKDPKHDCSKTEFKGPDGTWKTSAEYSLIRILTMTPANVVVEGTAIAGVQGLSDFLGTG